jgi:hypothetical protein
MRPFPFLTVVGLAIGAQHWLYSLSRMAPGDGSRSAQGMDLRIRYREWRRQAQ